MISNAIIQKTMEELASVTGAEYRLYDDTGRMVMTTTDTTIDDSDQVKAFLSRCIYNGQSCGLSVAESDHCL